MALIPVHVIANIYTKPATSYLYIASSAAAASTTITVTSTTMIAVSHRPWHHAHLCQAYLSQLIHNGTYRQGAGGAKGKTTESAGATATATK